MNKTIDGLREPGSVLLFEYHCTEDHGSMDAEIWYRSHQKVTVIQCVNSDESGDMTQEERYENGEPLAYLCRFADGLEWELMEDELLDSDSEYERPDPPERPPDFEVRAARRAFGYKDSAFVEIDRKLAAIGQAVPDA
jgi:hypothetical protein